jgi:hypothetical protein
MERWWLVTAQMEYLDADCGQNISDQSAVTAPPEKLCTHEDGAQPIREH